MATIKIRESTGGGYERRGKYFVRCTVRAGHREDKLASWATSLADVQERGRVVQLWINRLRLAGADEFVLTILERGAVAVGEGELGKVAAFVDAITGNKFARIEPKKREEGPKTFATFAEQWTTGNLHDLYPDHVRAKKSAADDEYRLGVLNEAIGNVPLVSFTLDHAEDAMRRLDEMRAKRGLHGKPAKLDQGGRRQYAQIIHRVLKMASYPARIIKTSPLPEGWLPPQKNNKAKGILWPDEEARTLGFVKHPVEWRVFFGALARLGFRVDEAASLNIEDVDVERGVITLDECKTDDPRAPTYGPDVMTALSLWKAHYRKGAKAGDPFFVRPDGARIRVDGLAQFYREEFVRGAGIDRAELFRRTATRLKLRVHDLRSFFVSYSLAGGATETWVMDRTGHKSSTMVNRYRRVARTAAEAGVGRPVPLHLAIPELAAAFTAANAAADCEKKERRPRRSARNHTVSGPIAQSVELRTFNSESGEDASARPQDSADFEGDVAPPKAPSRATPPRTAAASIDADEEELEAKMIEHDLAGRTTLARAYERRLERLRAAKPAGNVVPLLRERGR